MKSKFILKNTLYETDYLLVGEVDKKIGLYFYFKNKKTQREFFGENLGKLLFENNISNEEAILISSDMPERLINFYN